MWLLSLQVDEMILNSNIQNNQMIPLTIKSIFKIYLKFFILNEIY